MREDQRAQVSNPTIMAHNQFIELPAGRDILILKGLHFSLLNGAERLFNYGVIDGR